MITGSRRPQNAPRTPKKAIPESVRQAKTWDSVKNEIRRHGFCEPCAAQYAWGTQIGFTDSRPPCPDCEQLVAAGTGRERPNGWRSRLHKDPLR